MGMLLGDLQAMTFGTLKKRAREMGCDQVEVEAVDEADDHKQAVIELILLRMKATARDLQAMTLKKLKDDPEQAYVMVPNAENLAAAMKTDHIEKINDHIEKIISCAHVAGVEDRT